MNCHHADEKKDEKQPHFVVNEFENNLTLLLMNLKAKVVIIFLFLTKFGIS